MYGVACAAISFCVSVLLLTPCRATNAESEQAVCRELPMDTCIDLKDVGSRSSPRPTGFDASLKGSAEVASSTDTSSRPESPSGTEPRIVMASATAGETLAWGMRPAVGEAEEARRRDETCPSIPVNAAYADSDNALTRALSTVPLATSSRYLSSSGDIECAGSATGRNPCCPSDDACR